MYSKSLRFAMLVAAVLASACSIRAPWSGEKLGQETNLAFVMRNNLLYIPSTTVDGRTGTFLVGSAEATSVLDPAFARAISRHTLQLNEKQSLHFPAVNADLHGIADAILGADAWGPAAITIDYRAGLLTLQREGIHPELMTIYRFAAEPMISLTLDGKQVNAIVDTTSPDTLTIPGESPSRRTARVQIAGVDFGDVEVRVGGTSVPRVGNRLLSRFLITIDYGKRVVGLFHDRRG
jgi:hypothetical protein